MAEPVVEKLVIAGSLTIYEVASQVANWQARLDHRPAVLCLQDLTELDAAGFQALLALSKTLSQRGVNVEVLAPINQELANWLLPKLTLALGGGRDA